jgi:hypothetical protein
MGLSVSSQAFKSFKKCQSLNPLLHPPRAAGEDREPALSLSKGGGLNSLNDLNVLNAIR